MKHVLYILLFLFTSCIDNQKVEVGASNNTATSKMIEVKIAKEENTKSEILILENKYQKLKLSKGVNTKQNEYHPVPNSDGSILYFVGMDRTGQFSTKIDFTKTRSYGGEDIWFSKRKNGIYTESIPFSIINDHTHQSVTAIIADELFIYGIYEEAFKVDASGSDSDWFNGDIFSYNLKDDNLKHLGQPINSIFFESDAFVAENENTLLFVTDRNPINGNYKQKGFVYNNSFWGNTDIWISEKVEDYWTEPINLGDVINTEFAERTPYLSMDKTKLYFSSNGHPGYGEQDVFVSERLDMNNWTTWSQPKNLGEGVNGEYNDWGFKMYDEESKAMLASESKLPYKVESNLLGDGGIREHNLRNGYKVEGKQSGSFNYECRTDIYYVDLLNDNPIITIEDMLFDFNKYTVRSSNSNILDRLSEVIKDNTSNDIQIVGHTDNVGGFEYNQALSEKRAETIYHELIQRGVKKDRLNYLGNGESNSLMPNNTDYGRQKNRRVEIIFN